MGCSSSSPKLYTPLPSSAASEMSTASACEGGTCSQRHFRAPSRLYGRGCVRPATHCWHLKLEHNAAQSLRGHTMWLSQRHGNMPKVWPDY